MTQWFLAKYMPDLRRREPRNIGVILLTGTQVLSRFLGEDVADAGKIDGRIVRYKVGSTDNYRDWVHFWRASASHAPEQILTRRPGDNYYLERGGQQLAGHAADAEALLARLFAQLVESTEQSDEAAEEQLSDPVVQLFESVAPTLSFTQDYVVDLHHDEHVFDYAIDAGTRLLLFRHVLLNGNPRKTWDAVHTAAVAVQDVTDEAPNLSENPDPYVIVTKRHAGPSAPKQLRALQHKVGNRLREAAGLEADRDWLLQLADASR